MTNEIFTSKKGTVCSIRPVKLEDVKQIFTHYEQLLRDNEPIATIGDQKASLEAATEGMEQKLKRIHDGTFYEVVIEHQNKVVGNGGWYRTKGSTGHLAFIFFSIDKEFRNQGIAKKTAEILLENARRNNEINKMVAEILEVNNPSISLCKKLGFVEVARKPEWYRYNGKLIDEVVMIKNLNEAKQ